MKKVLKYTSITFAVLVALGILGNILGVETETAQPESEEVKEAAKEAEKEAEKIAKEQEKAAEQAVAEAENLAKEQEIAKAEAIKQIEKEATEAAKRAEEAKAAEAAKEISNSWEVKVKELATNTDSLADKFYSLETFMMSYSYSEKEVEQFKDDIIADYKSGTYLSEIKNDERMLTNIFKGYIVERGSTGAVKDFAFDYFQNMKYTYRGVDAVDSASVKSNESQMDRALTQL